MDISRDKLTKLYTRKSRHGYKRNLKKETESLLIATCNNAIRTNNIKAKSDNMQQNSKCMLCGDKDETVNLISECSQTCAKKVQDETWLDGPLRIVQEIEIWPYYQMVYAQTRIRSREKKKKSMEFSGTLRHKQITRQETRRRKKLAVSWILPFCWTTRGKWKAERLTIILDLARVISCGTRGWLC